MTKTIRLTDGMHKRLQILKLFYEGTFENVLENVIGELCSHNEYLREFLKLNKALVEGTE